MLFSLLLTKGFVSVQKGFPGVIVTPVVVTTTVLLVGDEDVGDDDTGDGDDGVVGPGLE